MAGEHAGRQAGGGLGRRGAPHWQRYGIARSMARCHGRQAWRRRNVSLGRRQGCGRASAACACAFSSTSRLLLAHRAPLPLRMRHASASYCMLLLASAYFSYMPVLHARASPPPSMWTRERQRRAAALTLAPASRHYLAPPCRANAAHALQANGHGRQDRHARCSKTQAASEYAAWAAQKKRAKRRAAGG